MVFGLPLNVADTIRLSCLTTDSRIGSNLALTAIPTPCIEAPIELRLAVDVNSTDDPMFCGELCQGQKDYAQSDAPLRR